MGFATHILQWTVSHNGTPPPPSPEARLLASLSYPEVAPTPTETSPLSRAAL